MPKGLKKKEIGGIEYLFRYQLLSTYFVPDPPTEKWSNVRVERRETTGPGGQSECREVGTQEQWGQQFGRYKITQYTIKTETSWAKIIGVSLLVVGGVALVATGIGAGAGAALLVTASGSITAAGAVIVTVEGLVIAAGVQALKEPAENEVVDTQVGEYEQDMPIDDQARLIRSTLNVEKTPWHPC